MITAAARNPVTIRPDKIKDATVSLSLHPAPAFTMHSTHRVTPIQTHQPPHLEIQQEHVRLQVLPPPQPSHVALPVPGDRFSDGVESNAGRGRDGRWATEEGEQGEEVREGRGDGDVVVPGSYG